MSDYIPAEIWPLILRNSTPETLLRCRCVCKSWKSLISSSFFVSSHLSLQKPHLIAGESNELHQIQLQNGSLFRPQTLYSFDFHFLPNPFSNFRIIGTANGVVCLAENFLGTTENIVLWNPLIRRCVYPPTSIYSSSSMEYTSTLGFGSDLKIVRIACVRRGSLFGRRSRFPPQAEVFSFPDWKWRSIDYDHTNCYTFENRWTQCLLNGVVHWSAYLKSTRNVLLSFNFEIEKFKLIELPAELHRGHANVSKLGNLLSVLEYKHTLGVAGAHGCHIWAMQEYGVVSSWSKMVSFDWVGGGLMNVMWVREDGGEMIVSTESDEVLCYDPCSKVAKSIGIRCSGDGFFTDGFVGSLVLLDESRLGQDKENGGCYHSSTSDLLNNRTVEASRLSLTDL